MRFALIALLLAASCSKSAPTACERACRTERECAETRRLADIDVAQCIETCRALLRDEASRRLVDEHPACVERAAKDCDAILDCP